MHSQGLAELYPVGESRNFPLASPPVPFYILTNSHFSKTAESETLELISESTGDRGRRCHTSMNHITTFNQGADPT